MIMGDLVVTDRLHISGKKAPSGQENPVQEELDDHIEGDGTGGQPHGKPPGPSRHVTFGHDRLGGV